MVGLAMLLACGVVFVREVNDDEKEKGRRGEVVRLSIHP